MTKTCEAVDALPLDDLTEDALRRAETARQVTAHTRILTDFLNGTTTESETAP